MEFHERLYEVRKNAGMTQSDLADKLGVSRQAVSRWEMGTAKPELENLVSISEIFGVSTDFLLKGTVTESVSAGDPPTQKAEKDPNATSIWEKLWLIGLCIFAILTLVFSIGSGDIMNGLAVSAFIVALLAVLIGVVLLIVMIIRDILKRQK